MKASGRSTDEWRHQAQLPSYLLIAVAEVLASVSGLEYAYTKAPENMRSVVMVSALAITGNFNALTPP